ncbi:hypothetical protein HAX54_035064 [Datura stramonium]|uniref:Uncharacterized protein n=1 Tax=Datura stramonium TaxID=4076 RepID=A0ABS8VEU6_DATST|nr:hypothetical protein [Datura stramonium]
MARIRNSDNNAPAAAAVGSSVVQGRAKKVPTKKKGRPTKATPLPQARQIEQGTMEMFTRFTKNQGQRGDQTPLPPREMRCRFCKKLRRKKSKREELNEIRTRRHGQPVGLAVQLVVEIKGCLVRGLQYLLSLHHRQAVVFQADIAKEMGASLARIRTSELQSLRVRVVLDNHPTRESLSVLAGRAIQVSTGVGYEVATTVEILDT